jgi:hypothetical protein
MTLHRYTQLWRLCLLLLLVLPWALLRCSIIPEMATPRWDLGQSLLLVLCRCLTMFFYLWPLFLCVQPCLVLRRLLLWLLLLVMLQPL